MFPCPENTSCGVIWFADAALGMPLDLPAVHHTEASFRYAMNEDAMATEKLAEGIRAFCVDAVKLEALMH